MTDFKEKLSCNQLLTGIEAEVKRCMDLLMRVEEEVLPLVSHPIAPTLRAALQDIDLLSQCLDDIARCIHGVSSTSCGTGAQDIEKILSSIRLQDMRQRLEGGNFDARNLVTREEMFDISVAETKVEGHLF